MEKIYNMSDITKMYQDWIIPVWRYIVQKLCEEWKIQHHRRTTNTQTKISIPESSLLKYFKWNIENEEEWISVWFEKI